MIKILNIKDDNFYSEFEKILSRSSDDINRLIPSTLEALNKIKQNGLEELLLNVKTFDKWNPTSLEDLIIKPEDMEQAYNSLEPSLKQSLNVAKDRIKAFHEKQKENGFIGYDEFGNIIGQSIRAINRVGLYIPGGKASYPSSLLMNAIPASVAGCKEIVVCTPANENKINSTLLASLHLCQIKQAYKIGGIGAIGLMAYGLKKQNVKKVSFISGPGNIYVATAKKLVFGEVGIDMIAGPSEIAILCDESADTNIVAYDLLSQAEHDEMASSFLFTTSLTKALQVKEQLKKNLEKLERRDIAEKSLQNRGAIFVLDDIKQAINLINELAPEHLELMVEESFSILGLIQNAGAIFLGKNTAEAIGDYLAGPNHTLPTSSSAKFFSPLSVQSFCKKSSIISFNEDGLKALGRHCENLANEEGLKAHKSSISARLDKLK